MVQYSMSLLRNRVHFLVPLSGCQLAVSSGSKESNTSSGLYRHKHALTHGKVTSLPRAEAIFRCVLLSGDQPKGQGLGFTVLLIMR